MNIFWKVISVAAITLSLVALVVATKSSKSDSEQIKHEVQRQLAEREQTLVARCKDTINRMRTDAGQPRKDIKTMEDALDGLISIFDIAGEPAGKTPSSPKK